MLLKRLAIVIVLLPLVAGYSLFAQIQEKTKVSPDSKEADADYQLKRMEWIRQMHRAAPDTDPEQMDIQTRNAKYQASQNLRYNPKHSISPQSVIVDSVAGGRVAGSWIERGSDNICGRMITADIDFDNEIIYAASAMGNIWKAGMENTNQWTSLNDDRRFGDVRLLRSVTTSKGKRLIAVANGPVNVYYSDDGGLTWLTATGLSGPQSWGGFKRAVMTSNEQTIYLCGNEWDYTNWHAITSLYRSNDQGKTFSNIGKWNYNSDLCDVWISRNAPSLAYFLKGDSLFRIPATGTPSFLRKMTYSVDVASVGSLLLQGSVKNNVTTLAVLETTNNIGTISVSSNAGTSWKTTGTFDGSPFGNNSFKVLESDPKIMAIGTSEAFISRDNGATWDHTNGWGEYYGDELTKLHADIDGIDFIQDPTGKELQFFSTDGGIFMSQDTLASFTNITLSGIETGQFYSVLTARQAPYFIYGGSQDQGYQRTQDSVAGFLGLYQTTSGDYGHVTSSDGGKSTWCDYPGFAMLYANAQGPVSDRSWNFQGSNHLWMPPVIADPQNPHAAYIACGGAANESYVWHLTNDTSGITATHWSFDFSLDSSTQNVSAIAFSPLDHARSYVLTNDGLFFYSLNTGSTWVQSDFGNAPPSHYFYGSVILPSTKNKNMLWIAGSGYSNPGVFVSADNGVSFLPIDSGLPHTMIYGLAATDDEKFLFAATDVGPYIYSVDAGIWYDMSVGHAPDMVYWSVDYIPALKTVRFGTYGRGIWDFVIGGAPTPHSYTITSPKAGEVITGGTTDYVIKYSSENPGKKLQFEYSLDGGTWSSVSGTPGASIFTWTQLPDTASTQAVVRISDELGTAGKSGTFTITKKASPGAILTLTLAGVTNNKIAGGAPMNISWTTNGGDFGTGFTAEYSTDSAASWKLIKSVGPKVLQTAWLTPQGYFPNSYIRVRGTDADKSNVSRESDIFAIGQQAAVTGANASYFQVSNYPNPLSTITTFEYSVPERCVTNLQIFDVMGREIASVVKNEIKLPGRYSEDFDASQLPSGSYTYVLTAGARSMTGRMTVTK